MKTIEKVIKLSEAEDQNPQSSVKDLLEALRKTDRALAIYRHVTAERLMLSLGPALSPEGVAYAASCYTRQGSLLREDVIDGFLECIFVSLSGYRKQKSNVRLSGLKRKYERAFYVAGVWRRTSESLSFVYLMRDVPNWVRSLCEGMASLFVFLREMGIEDRRTFAEEAFDRFCDAKLAGEEAGYADLIEKYKEK